MEVGWSRTDACTRKSYSSPFATMPFLEGLRYDRTPMGVHYTLIHYDVPFVDAGTWPSKRYRRG